MGPGSKGSNQAVGVTRLGAHSSLAAIIGTDKLAEIATDLYATEGVGCDLICGDGPPDRRGICYSQ